MKNSYSIYERFINHYMAAEFEQALADIEEAVLLNSEEADWLCCKANTLFFLKKYPETIAACNEALFLNPAGYMFLYLKSLSLRKLGMDEKALVECRKALRLNPHSYLASVVHQQITGEVYQPHSEEKTASVTILLDVFKEILLLPASSEQLMLKADRLRKLAEDEYEEKTTHHLLSAAQSGYLAVLSKNPNLLQAWEALAYTSIKLRQRKEAEHAFMMAKKLTNGITEKENKMTGSDSWILEFLANIPRADKEIIFTREKINHQEMNILIADLKSRENCKSLYFCQTEIEEHALCLLVDSLEFNKTLTHLHFKTSSIKDPIILQLAKVLEKNTSLIYLSFIDIGWDGAVALSEALKINHTLTEVIVPESTDYITKLKIESLCEKNRNKKRFPEIIEVKNPDFLFYQNSDSCRQPIPLAITGYDQYRLLPENKAFTEHNQFLKDVTRINIFLRGKPLEDSFFLELSHLDLQVSQLDKLPNGEQMIESVMKDMIQSNKNIFAILNKILTPPITEQLFLYFNQMIIYACTNILTDCAKYISSKDIIIKPGRLVVNIDSYIEKNKSFIEFTTLAENFYYTEFDPQDPLKLLNTSMFPGAIVMTKFRKNPIKQELLLYAYTNKIELVKDIFISYCHQRRNEIKYSLTEQRLWTQNKSAAARSLLTVYKHLCQKLPNSQEFSPVIEDMMSVIPNTLQTDEFFCRTYKKIFPPPPQILPDTYLHPQSGTLFI